MKFIEFGLNKKVLEAISYMGFENATPIQEKTIPEIMDGRDVIACAQTGTGKTAAFILPILHMLTENPSDDVFALVIVPTRELAIQIEQQIQGLSYFISVSSLAVYGGGDGSDWEDQKKALIHGANIIVATPGKLISHLNMGYVQFDQLKCLILDEADRMLDMGFMDDIQKIISYLPKDRQTLMFSATMPPNIRTLATRILKNPFRVDISASKPVEGVTQGAYLLYNNQKTPLVKFIIESKPEYESILVFTSMKRKVFEIVRGLKSKNYMVEGISSDLDQQQREDVLTRFRSKQTKVLIATDVLSRGIDIKDINLIINYDVPGSEEDYVHRIGRTARASTKGEATTLINETDMYKFKNIERFLEYEVNKISLPVDLGEGPAWNPKSIPRRSNQHRSFRKV